MTERAPARALGSLPEGRRRLVTSLGARPLHRQGHARVVAARSRCRGAAALISEAKHQPRPSDPVLAHLRAGRSAFADPASTDCSVLVVVESRRQDRAVVILCLRLVFGWVWGGRSSRGLELRPRRHGGPADLVGSMNARATKALSPRRRERLGCRRRRPRRCGLRLSVRGCRVRRSARQRGSLRRRRGRRR